MKSRKKLNGYKTSVHRELQTIFLVERCSHDHLCFRQVARSSRKDGSIRTHCPDLRAHLCIPTKTECVISRWNLRNHEFVNNVEAKHTVSWIALSSVPFRMITGCKTVAS